MIGRLLCRLGWHRLVRLAELTHYIDDDEKMVCIRCRKVR